MEYFLEKINLFFGKIGYNIIDYFKKIEENIY